MRDPFAPVDPAPYSEPSRHAWQCALLFLLSDAEALAMGRDQEIPLELVEGQRPIVAVRGPVCARCREDWHPAVALLPCRPAAVA